ncbi:glycosyl hydrolase family 65 protein [Sediminispirochaeta bajacaliforniensis]|uniref:glycosyl hydrolase family 65 protein n=1 Tax=Sediminispirochaeta bajacaliforniensis TaxID=148 RepID=UPI00036C38A6|nr:glycosyl hydrolase family 65 protein [Sediminispirochaeta bajacaliforniensis]
MKSSPHFAGPWLLEQDAHNKEGVVAMGSNFLCANGYLGYRGTFPHWRKESYVACVVEDTWDNADGIWSELSSIPNGLYFRVENGEGKALQTSTAPEAKSFLRLDLEKALLSGSMDFDLPESGRITCSFTRLANISGIHLLAQRMVLSADTDCSIIAVVGIDTDVWSLNGNHFATLSQAQQATNAGPGIDMRTGQSGIDIALRQALLLNGTKPREGSNFMIQEGIMLRPFRLALRAGESVTIDVGVSIYSSRDLPHPQEESEEDAKQFLEQGFDAIREEHEACWKKIWERYTASVDSDDDAWGILNFNTYHNVIATPSHSDHLPIGARGLSCQAYQGAAFWDQEIFNLPGHLYAQPETARRLLSYRYKTLDGARRKAARLGFEGAFYAWISGDSGDELCPDYFFKDVLTGRKIRNHFNDWQIHISPDIAYAIRSYRIATGDDSFSVGEGAEILFEVARFIASRVVWLPRKSRYEIHQVIGPDEYHENANNNLFTNVQCRFALTEAFETLQNLKQHHPKRLEELTSLLQLEEQEPALWNDIADKLFIPGIDPTTGLLPQFDGYFDLEDIAPSELAGRLKDSNEYWGWPNGIAFETQVIKQADVIQLFYQHPHLYDKETMRRNYRYYEKRTQHRSSLSPAIHAIVAARLGFADEAYRYFLDAGLIDLYNSKPAISGGTFIGGIHTAACGIARQMAIQGFAGIEACERGIRFEPALPEVWKKLSFPFYYHGNRIEVTVEKERAIFEHKGKGKSIPLLLPEKVVELAAGENVEVHL